MFVSIWWHIFQDFQHQKAVQTTPGIRKPLLERQRSGKAVRRRFRPAAGLALERIFRTGFAEYPKQHRQPNADHGMVMESTRRAMKAASQREAGSARRASGVSRDGRFGQPVCRPVRHRVGHHEFRSALWATSAGHAGAHVAPGIAEALVATAIGLLRRFRRWLPTTALPATSTGCPGRFDTFVEEFSNILQRQAARTDARGKRRAMAQMNVVPYIDVMLVLLVIFMVAAPMMQPGRGQPAAGRQGRNWPAPLKITISASGDYSLRDPAGQKYRAQLELDELIDKVTKLASQNGTAGGHFRR